MTDRSRGVALAAASGVLSFAACFVPDHGTSWGAGIVFGLLVLGPTRHDARGFLALAALSTAVYRAAVWLAVRLAVDTPVPAVAACALAGVLGALALAFGAGAVRGVATERGPALRAALWGALAGLAIGFATDRPDGSIAQHALLLAGFVVWQVGYTASHHLAPWRGGVPGRPPAPADVSSR